jgi:hypothetical protein
VAEKEHNAKKTRLTMKKEVNGEGSVAVRQEGVQMEKDCKA